MSIIGQASAFVQSLRELASRTVWDWRRCSRCGSTITRKNGSYRRRPWFLEGRRTVRVQRHWCHSCRRSYSEASALLVRGSWYARDVHRLSIDHWQHVGSSLRRTAEFVRSWLGHQERWHLWRLLDAASPERERCYLAASTVHRWLDGAGQRAEASVSGQLAEVPISRQMGTDGLWVRLRGGAQRVVLILVDYVSGVVWPPVVVEGEDRELGWDHLFMRAKTAGLHLAALRGVTSDGSSALLSYLKGALKWVNHQRCVWHLWRGLAELFRETLRAAIPGGSVESATQRREMRRELTRLVHGVLDAVSYSAAEEALAKLRAHAHGERLAKALTGQLDAALVHLQDYNRGLLRVGPEWLWRDFRLRLSRGRNHGAAKRYERAALVWAIYRNFTPAQWRSERKRHYCRPGQSPLAKAGVPPGELSYLDALGV